MKKTSVSLPAAGKGACLSFSLEAMEALAEEFGDEYVAITIRKLDLCEPKTLRMCFDLMAQKTTKTLAETLESMTAQDIAYAMADAMMLSIRGQSISDINAAAG